jgi:hypothetical protein
METELLTFGSAKLAIVVKSSVAAGVIHLMIAVLKTIPSRHAWVFSLSRELRVPA